ncbi:hypothetical protein RvY_08508-2 [Ramazzottius varieornatus]|uniref:Uncharacterized protein n=1 Tax=Ramazzottius varieornatus TaxID=947166 RepID=A0A1D1VBN2_RAMVA|nr:hypothetical protein RvY_08508-2 [Ramazzottius varieornatus]
MAEAVLVRHEEHGMTNGTSARDSPTLVNAANKALALTEGNASFLRAARAGNIDKVQDFLRNGQDINTANANGLNALHLASKEGHVDLVRLLLERGAAVDAATRKGNTSLHIGCLAGQTEIVKILIDHGGSVNVQSQNGFTPLYMAAQENHVDIVRYLLEHSANQSLATEDGFTPLAVALQQGHDKVVSILLESDTRSRVRLPALHIAAKKDDVRAATLLLDSDQTGPDVTSKSGFTPLHIAAHYGNVAIGTLLLDRGANVNFAASKHNITPLHVAAKWGRANMVELLLNRGAEIDAKTRDGLTPLHCGARSGHDRVVDLLLQKGSPNSPKTKNGLAPLHMAAQGDHVDSARALLYYKAPVDDVTVDYLTPLHVAAHCGHVRVAKLLLDRRADPNARALNGFTPLHIACKKNRIKVVELLLKHGASIDATTESGLTPLHVASFMGCMNIVLYLIQHGANPDVTTVRGETPLHLAVRSNQTDIIRILLRNGAKVDAKARENQTPLHIATRLGHLDNAALLIQHGAVIDIQTKDLYTPLHIAAKEGQEEVAMRLIEQGASLTATTRKGFTPLHLAAKYGHLNLVKLFLDKGAAVDTQGKNGVTPLHVAAHYDNVQVAHLLLQRGASPQATAKNGYTPLHISAKKNQLDIANSLIKYKADPNAESKAGFTPVHLASQEGHTEMLYMLVKNGGDVNARAKNGLAPLHLAAQEDHVPIGEILVQNKAELNPETKAGYTPLHVASHFGQLNMVRFLLDQGADVNLKTSYGYTPLHQAAQQGQTQVVNVLLQHQAQPNEVSNQGQTALSIAEKLGYVSVVETLKVVTETIVTTTTTTVTEEKLKVQQPESMQEAFISDSEDEADKRMDDEEDEGLARYSPDTDHIVYSPTPPERHQVMIEERVVHQELPGIPTRARNPKVTTTTITTLIATPSIRKDRSKSPDYHAELSYEDSAGIPLQGAYDDDQKEREHYTEHVTQEHIEPTEYEHTIHTRNAPRGGRSTEDMVPYDGTDEQIQYQHSIVKNTIPKSPVHVTSDYKQYETTTKEVTNIESRGYAPRHVPDVVVLTERTESRSGMTSPMQVRTGEYSEAQRVPAKSAQDNENFIRFELVAPPTPPSRKREESPLTNGTKKKRRWFSFGSRDKSRPAAENEAKTSTKSKDKSSKKRSKSSVAESAATASKVTKRFDSPQIETLHEDQTESSAVKTSKEKSSKSKDKSKFKEKVAVVDQQFVNERALRSPNTIESIDEKSRREVLPDDAELTMERLEQRERAYKESLERAPNQTVERLGEAIHQLSPESAKLARRTTPKDATNEAIHATYSQFKSPKDRLVEQLSQGTARVVVDDDDRVETAYSHSPSIRHINGPREGTVEQLNEYTQQNVQPDSPTKKDRGMAMFAHRRKASEVDSDDENDALEQNTQKTKVKTPKEKIVEMLSEGRHEFQVAEHEDDSDRKYKNKPLNVKRAASPGDDEVEVLDESVVDTELADGTQRSPKTERQSRGRTSPLVERAIHDRENVHLEENVLVQNIPDSPQTEKRGKNLSVTITPTATKKSSMKGSSPRTGATEHIDESVRSTSVEDEGSAQKSPRKLQFARRSVSQQGETDTESETDDDEVNLDESVRKDRIKRKPHVKRQKKVSKEGYEAVPTDEYLNERVSHKELQREMSLEKVKPKKDKDKSTKEKVVTTRPLNLDDEVGHERENLDEAVVIATSQNLKNGVPLTDEYYQQESYRVKGSPGKTRKTSPGRQERIETEVITTIEPVEKTKLKVKPEKPPKPEKLKKAKTPEVPIQEVFVRIVDVTGALEEPETEEQRLTKKKLEKERAKQEKKFAEERDKAEKAAAKEREKAEKEAQKAARKGATEKKSKEKEDRLERISEISEKQARLTPDDIEMIDENVSLRELTPTPELKTKVQKVFREKTPTRISIAEETERSRILDSGLGDSPVARSPSQPFSPVIKSPRVESERTQRAEAVSPTMEQLKVGGHRSRSKSPGGDKTVVDLNEKVAKTKSPTRSDAEGEGDGRTHVELYETPWVPLNREEDRDDEGHIASSNRRTNEVPATSPPEHTFNYMQEATRTYPDHHAERTMEGQALYASGYSEGKMSPQVEAKTSPVRVLAPPIAVPPTRAENVNQENVRTEKRPKENGYQETLYEDSVTHATQQPRKPSTSWNQKESFEQIIREAEARRTDQPNYHAAIVGHEPETVRDDLHELEGTFAPDNVDLRMNAPIRGGFLVSFLVDARGGAMRGCRHSGIRVIIPPRKAPCPMRITCKYLTKDKVAIPPPLMEGEGLACRILEMGPLGAKFLGPVIIEIPHFASLRENEREVQILRSENGQTWREHTLEATEDAVQKVLNESFDPDELSAIEDLQTNRIIRILTTDFPLYFAIVSRIRQEVHAVGPDGGIITSTVQPQVQALFPEGALTKKIKVGVQAHVIPPDVVARLLASNRIAVSPIVTVEPRRRKFHKPITLTIPLPRAAGKGMVNQYTSDSPNLRLLCSITGGTTPAQWEDITGSTPLVIVNDCIQFTTTVSARFWLMDCGHNISEAVRFGHAVYSDACVVPYMAKFVVYARRFDNEEARLRVFCMTDDKEDKTLEHQERFVEVSKSRDVEVLEGKNLYIEMAGNLIPVTKSGDQIHFPFYPFQENRLPFLVKVKDPNDDAQGRLAFMREAKSGRNDLPQTPICNLSVRLPDELSPMEPTQAKDLVTIVRRPVYMREIGKAGSVHKADVRLHDVADMVGSDWPALAQQLGFRDPEIQSLMDEEPKTNIQAFNMLRRWIARRDVTKSAGNELEQALKRIGRDDIVNKVMFNVKLLTDDLDRTMARLSVDRDQVGFDALHEEIGPGTSAVEGGTETFVRDYVRGYREPVRAESEPTSETTSLHEHVMEEEVGANRSGEPATKEVLHERVTQQRPPSPPQRQISQREREEATSRLSSTMRSMDTPVLMRDVENTRESERLYETVSQREVVEPRAVEVRTLTGQVSPTAEVVVSREDVRRTSPAEPTPPSPRTKPVPPPRHDQPHVQYAEHVSTFELPKETPTYVREAGVDESTPTVSEARRLSGPAPADDNAQKSISQKQFETVETEHDEDGNLVTKKTITTVKTTRSTRTITGDQDELIKQATEGELRNIPQSVLGDVQQQSRVDISGPEITDVTESYVRDNQSAEEATSPQRPSQLFAGGFSGARLNVDSSTVPIIETPSTNVLIDTTEFETQGQLSPVELTENQPEFRDESLAETQMPIVEEPLGGMTPSAAQQSERVTEETEHTEDDTFDMRHSVPGRRNRTPDPTPELPEERSWTRADFGFRPTLGMRQYSESEFSEAELRDLARRPSDVSIQDLLPRPISPEPESSASPQVDLDQGINIQSTPEDEEAPEYLPPLEDIQEEKESTSESTVMASSLPEEETEVLEETVVTHDEPIEEGSEEVDLTEHDVKEQQKRMET